MTEDLATLLTKPVPRYTSYPTAPHFHAGIGPETHEGWLRALPDEARLSLYLHVPFCDRLCWFCGCHTKQVNRHAPVVAYLDALEAEIERIGSLLGDRQVTAVHWGGGSPSLLLADDIVRMAGALRRSFAFGEQVEFSVELDPNDMAADRFSAWAEAGMTRASIGVQDFDPKVQAAINRIQTFEQTRSVVDAVRAVGVTSVNIDMLYGLPHQTVAGATETALQVAALAPDRVALFGYAHVPWMKKHQTMIDEAALPGALDRYRQSHAAVEVLVAAGYERIGFDHFALPEDTLAVANRSGRLHRNFQGYTADEQDALIGLGASAISRLPQGHVQNVVATHEYQRRVQAGQSAVDRGVAFTADDILRGYAIERLLCDFRLDFAHLRARFGGSAEAVIEDAVAIAMDDELGLVRLLPGCLEVTDAGRPFVRTVAAGLDAYLDSGAARYSKAV
ncbi:oxygen-independent coproporphyrinogen III oxidase [Devosia sp. SL43]|uniref:oxygen-independent coproporphyrinogen III oxidase n=1 Tax=Devosia sp. SL43 TaxID=2806348 RepID=UPI001F012E12|nr:oxygen-independent coproporphyrinogen III oxidase [Devosia sp. SL43]UJW85562.1 oxygen-independent coproporphyrinogen III oxidase [Devosia sp. SL43]